MNNYRFSQGSLVNSILPKTRDAYLQEIAENLFAGCKRVLLVPPDISRLHSGAGDIVSYLYRHFSPSIRFDIMPALGTHCPMTSIEINTMFGAEIPKERFLSHHWRKDLHYYGNITSETLSEIFKRHWKRKMAIAINKQLELGRYDLILSIGQVVPHEIVGMANYTKNILIGLGGEEAIHQSHFLGAVYGLEKIMGCIDTPVRKLLNLAFNHYLSHLPIQFLYTVVEKVKEAKKEDRTIHLKGLYSGQGESSFIEAATLSQQCNLNLLSKPIKKAVVYLAPEQFKSAWLSNKAIYRLRMAMADDGELFILSPGLKQFGEDKTIDSLIRQYGYIGQDAIWEKTHSDEQLRNNLSAAAHLIHGSSEGRFKIIYCPGSQMSRKEIEAVGFEYLSYDQAKQRFNWKSLVDGYNEVINEGLVFYVSNPGLGLWALANNFPKLKANTPPH